MVKQDFNINKIIEHYNLYIDEVAQALFPNIRYQKFALDRVLKGEALLNTDQIQALANLAGVFVYDLFNIDSWKGKTENGHLVFVKGDYKVRLNYNGAYLSIYKGSELIYQELASCNMTIKKFIERINKIINN